MTGLLQFAVDGWPTPTMSDLDVQSKKPTSSISAAVKPHQLVVNWLFETHRAGLFFFLDSALVTLQNNAPHPGK